MNAPSLQLLLVDDVVAPDEASPWGPFSCQRCSRDEAAAALEQRFFDALLLPAADAASATALLHWPPLAAAVLGAAVIVLTPEDDAELAAQLVAAGVQDVQDARQLQDGGGALERALRLAIERKRVEAAQRSVYSTDLATGLPNHGQLLEHMAHLIALREREPAPMALVVLRIDGLTASAESMGAEAAGLLRRKAAVRLRAGLRASDVVASIGRDLFAVLLAWIDAPTDAERVAAKMLQALRQPFAVAGQQVALTVGVGVARFPEQGTDADSLLRAATAQAAFGQPVAGLAARGGGEAANDA